MATPKRKASSQKSPAPPKKKAKTEVTLRHRDSSVYISIQNKPEFFEAWVSQQLASNQKNAWTGKVERANLSEDLKKQLTSFNTHAKLVEAWYNDHVEKKVTPAALDAVCFAISSQHPQDPKARIYKSGRDAPIETRSSKDQDRVYDR